MGFEEANEILKNIEDYRPEEVVSANSSFGIELQHPVCWDCIHYKTCINISRNVGKCNHFST